MSAKSAPQIMFIKVECAFLFLNFLTIGLCHSFANCCSDEARPFCYPSYLELLVVPNALSCNILSEAVPQFNL